MKKLLDNRFPLGYIKREGTVSALKETNFTTNKGESEL